MSSVPTTTVVRPVDGFATTFSNDILAEPRQLPADRHLRRVRERAALVADFLAVEEQRPGVAEAGAPVEDRRACGEVGQQNRPSETPFAGGLYELVVVFHVRPC